MFSVRFRAVFRCCRLLVPARLYLAGKAGHVVASGLNATAVGGPRSLADDTAALRRVCGVPDHAIIRDATARTTSAEIRVFKQRAAERGSRHGVAFVDARGEPGWIGRDPALSIHRLSLRGSWPPGVAG